MKYINTGKRLKKIEKFLDKKETEFVKKVYDKTGYPVGHELREIVEELGGEWSIERIKRNQYDTLNIPYLNGTLIIERPWMDLNKMSYYGHKVSFNGEITKDLEKLIIIFLTNLVQKEREKSKEFFIEYLTTEEPIPKKKHTKEDVQELVNLFD